MEESHVGIVVANNQSRPLEFWVEVLEDAPVQLDDLITLELKNPINPEKRVRVFAVIDDIVDHVEGLQFPGDTEAFTQGYTFGRPTIMAHARVTRYTPDVLRPPRAGDKAYLAKGELLKQAMYVDQMANPLPIGVLRNGQPAYLNYDFVNGVAGAHINISGISGVATKTSFALWTLYSILNSKREGGGYVDEARSKTKAIIFNVKGTDLFFLDKPNRLYQEKEARITVEMGVRQSRYEVAKLPPAPFERVAIRTPAAPHNQQPGGARGRREPAHPICVDAPGVLSATDAADDVCARPRQPEPQVSH